MTIMFLIRSLDHGGAQRQLINLAIGLKRLGHKIAVVTFYSGQPLEKELNDMQVLVRTLGKRSRWDIVRSTMRLITIIRAERPDILYSYLSTANLLAFIPRIICRSLKIVWGVRASDMRLDYYDWLVKLSFLCECFMSKFAHLIIANSYSGRDYYIDHGFPSTKTVVIQNGIDVDRFRPDSDAGKKVRAEWGIPDGFPLVGNVGRLDPIKDHFTFLNAAMLLARERSNVRFVCVGEGPDEYRSQLLAHARTLGIEGLVTWAGSRSDMPAVYNALDVVVSASISEGFPNVLGEAMACGVPCVATNVGDCAQILSKAPSKIVPISNPGALAEGITGILESGTPPQSVTALRKWISETFDQSRMVKATEQAVMSLVCN